MSGERVSLHRPAAPEVAADRGRKSLPLAAPVRAAMETGFGYDFSSVRLHADAEADAAARALRAHAFTVGSDVFLARGVQPSPRLIAHELAHVVQQGGRAPATTVPDPAGEHAADEAARVVAAGGRAQVRPLSVTGPQCAPDPSAGGGSGLPPALTPEEMWTQLVQSQRGFGASPSGAGDTYRASPATVPPGSLAVDAAGNPVAKGAPLGKGYETYAAVQLVDADGKRVAVAADSFHGTGPDAHAEAHCVRALEAHGPAKLPGGKLIVVGDQTICPTCRERLIAYAKSRGLTVIEPHEPVRPKIVGVGEASPKTTSRSSTQADRPALTIVAREPIPITPPKPPTPKSSPPTPPAKPKTAVPPGEDAPHTTKLVPSEPEVIKRGRVSVEVEIKGGKPTARLKGLETKGLPKEETPALSRTPKGSLVAKAFTAVSLGRTLLDLYASASDEPTRTKIEKVTHPLQSYLRSTISDAEAEFLAGHPDPAALATLADVEDLRAVYETDWRKLSAHQVQAAFLMVGLVLVPEDKRGPEWYATLGRIAQGAAAPPREVEAFRGAAKAYESRGIDLLQEVAPYRAGLPQLADEIDRRAGVLQTIADDLEAEFFELAARFPILDTELLPLLSEGQFFGELAGRMHGFAEVVRLRDKAYTDLNERLDAELRRLGRHINNPGTAIGEPPPRPRP